MNVALIGTGYIAGRHAEALAAEPGITIVGHVDVAPAGAEAAAAKWGGRAYGSVSELLDHETVEAAWVCVPPFAHGQTETALVAAGVPLYIEKPVGNDLAVPQGIADLIQAKNLVVNVGYYLRCAAVTPKLRELLAETPPRFVRLAWHGVTPPAQWWQQQAKSGGQVVEQATHLLDIARFLLGEPEVLFATDSHLERAAFPGLDVATTTVATLRFTGDVLAQFSATCVLDHTTDSVAEFYCEGRKISFTRTELIIETPQGKAAEPIGEDPLVLADRRFIAAVVAGDPAAVPCSYDEALATQRLCLTIAERA